MIPDHSEGENVMTLRHLRIFREVMEKKSATRAAEALGMTQPAVSIALGELETFYETRLFDRVGRRLVPTEAGERLLCHAEAILSRMERSVSELREKKRGAPCRIGVNVTVGEGRFPRVFAALRARLPEVRLHLTVERNDLLERLLSEGMLDLAIMDRPDERKNRRAKPLFSERMKAVCAPALALRLCPGMRSEEGETPPAVAEREERDAAPEESLSIRPLSPDALARMPLLLREKGSGLRECADALLASARFPTVPTVESVSSGALLSLAEAGEGVAILPASLVDGRIAGGTLRELPLEGAPLLRRYSVVLCPGKVVTPETARCMEILEALLADGGQVTEQR